MTVIRKQKSLQRFSFCVMTIFIAVSVYGQEAASVEKSDGYSKTTYKYKTADDHELLADVYRYVDDEVRPSVLWLHGGALLAGDKSFIDSAQVKMYVEAGYTVVSANYRLAPETKLAEIINDLEDAYAWMLKEGPSLYNIDPGRVAVVGHSAGAYLTLMAGIRLYPRPKALVSFYGYGDITGPWYSQPDSLYNQSRSISKKEAYTAIGDSVISGTATESSWNGRMLFYLYTRQQGLWPTIVGGRDPVKDREWFKDYEPVFNVSSDYPPTLLLHGEIDTDVPYELSVNMAHAFVDHDVDYEFISRPEWDHGFDSKWKEPEVRAAFDRVIAFLNKYVK